MEAILTLFAVFADDFVDVNVGDRFYKTKLIVAWAVTLIFDLIAVALLLALVWIVATGSIFHGIGLVVFLLLLGGFLYIGYMGGSWTLSLLKK